MSNLLIPQEEGELSHGAQYDAIGLLRHRQRSATVLYGIFLELLRTIYKDAAGRQEGAPLCVWNNDPARTEVWIDTELRWEDEHPEFRPAIYVKLGELGYQSLTGRTDGMLESYIAESTKAYERICAGSVSFVHVGHTAGEACSLADVTSDYLDAFNSVIRCDFGFNQFYLHSRVALAPAQKESKDRKESTVTFNFMCSDTWTVQLEAPKLKNVTFSAGQ